MECGIRRNLKTWPQIHADKRESDLSLKAIACADVLNEQEVTETTEKQVYVPRLIPKGTVQVAEERLVRLNLREPI